MSNDPFDWKNYKPVVDMKDVERARKSSYQSTRVINQIRAKGVEPSIVYSPNGQDTQPKKFVIDMPHMPVLRPNRKKR